MFCGPGLLLSYDLGNAAGILDEIVAGAGAVYYGGVAVVTGDAGAAASSTILGAPAALYDLGNCLAHDHADCIGAIAGLAGVAGSGISVLENLSETAAGLLGALGGAAGSASTAYGNPPKPWRHAL